MDKLIAAIIASSDPRLSNNEFILSYWGGNTWSAGLGNPSQHVSLGESSPDVEARGSSAIEALENLARELGVVVFIERLQI